jgi:outer membrane protein OmpA-like peptidoglycan-associated protein
MKRLIFAISILVFASCNQKGSSTTQPDKLIIRFELDSTGHITDTKVKEQVLTLAKYIQKSADKRMIIAYTEQSGNEEQNAIIGKAMAIAVRELMKTEGERNATNVGFEVKGYTNPVDSINPSSMVNRRIEIVPI